MSSSVKSKTRLTVSLVISIVFFIGAFVPVLVLGILGNHQKEIILVVSSLVLAWLIVVPFILITKRKLSAGYAISFCSIAVFLFVVEQNTMPGQWFFQLAVPVFLTGMAGIGLIGLIWGGFKFRFFYACFLTLVILSIITYLENYFYIRVSENFYLCGLRNFVAGIIGLSSVPFLITGLIVHRKNLTRKTRIQN